ncbi:MAG: conjugal transfer protein [Neisseria sp.]|nr:conjugal transfer protein [Neisseria sp.]
MSQRILPDTRPYPSDPVKNELLLHAASIAQSNSKAQTQLASETLQARIFEMLQQNHYLGLSVAMSMAPDSASYSALFHALDSVLAAKTEDEVQWFALPVVVVAGCNQASDLPLNTPDAALSACLENYPHTRAFSHAQCTWLPKLIPAAQLAAIDAGTWFAAKQNAQAAAQFANTLQTAESLHIEAGQSVHVLFALAYGSANIQPFLGKNLQDAALPLMQVWQENLKTAGLTLFTNPLSPASPLNALNEGNHIRLRMALDVFSTNAIRAIRLQSPRVGVVLAAQEGGRLLFGFNATESQFELLPQVFAWPLSPMERVEIVQQNFLDLLAECQVENVRLLHDALPEGAELPNYAQALQLAGHNPFFADFGEESALLN